MEQNQEKDLKKSPVPLTRFAIRAAILAVLVGVIVLLLFGMVGGNWLIGVLAGFCCLIGVFLCVLGWSYFKALERYYKANPPAETEDGQEEPDEAPEPGSAD
ncbi:MAG: hypothetical protein LUD79_04995 [Oscillospiraceae bacterium]|nr:hypothetical protein [Oscillospiraceae bacterium]